MQVPRLRKARTLAVCLVLAAFYAASPAALAQDAQIYSEHDNCVYPHDSPFYISMSLQYCGGWTIDAYTLHRKNIATGVDSPVEITAMHGLDGDQGTYFYRWDASGVPNPSQFQIWMTATISRD